MPRYTDIDQLIDKVEETTWYHINKNGELVVGANSETDVPLYKHSDITRVLEEAPVADVVPKSEVAMEILEEITDIIMFAYKNDIIKYIYLFYFTSKIAELKKKYTEESK